MVHSVTKTKITEITDTNDKTSPKKFKKKRPAFFKYSHEALLATTLVLVCNNDAPILIRQLSQKKQKLCTKLWITNGILKSIKTKDKLYKTHFLSNNPIKYV